MPGRRVLCRMVVTVSVLGVLVSGVSAAPDNDDIRAARDRRETVKDEAASTAEQLELVKAEDVEVADALRALDEYVALQQAKIAAAAQINPKQAICAGFSGSSNTVRPSTKTMQIGRAHV